MISFKFSPKFHKTILKYHRNEKKLIRQSDSDSPFSAANKKTPDADPVDSIDKEKDACFRNIWGKMNMAYKACALLWFWGGFSKLKEENMQLFEEKKKQSCACSITH